jgi:RimJ/RimL family protein N-acetyltransferase
LADAGLLLEVRRDLLAPGRHGLHASLAAGKQPSHYSLYRQMGRVVAVEIRQMREEDLEGFRAVFDTVAQERRFLLVLEAPPLESMRASIQKSIFRRHPRLIALDEGGVIGWCHVIPFEHAIATHSGNLVMGLLPGYRGQHLGERLIRQTLEAADSFGLKRVQLEVFATNAPAACLYRKVGFVEEGVKRRAVCIDGVYIDEIMMARLKE